MKKQTNSSLQNDIDRAIDKLLILINEIDNDITHAEKNGDVDFLQSREAIDLYQKKQTQINVVNYLSGLKDGMTMDKDKINKIEQILNKINKEKEKDKQPSYVR